MAAAGANVAITYRMNEIGALETAAAVERHGQRAAIFQLDVADTARLDDIGPAAVGALGRLDVWVNNAGADILTTALADATPTAKLDALLAVDLRGTILASWQAVEILRAHGTDGVLINISWDHVTTGMPGLDPQLFAAVKGGVAAFSRALARSVAPDPRVNILAPGWIDTAFGDGLDEGRRRAIAATIPTGRWGTPEDVANAAVFLASPGSSYLTGQTINIGGGVVM
jgi:3-oxoacyl-[acyl-carrier protein] reductase